jgi:hypothetical protein
VHILPVSQLNNMGSKVQSIECQNRSLKLVHILKSSTDHLS